MVARHKSIIVHSVYERELPRILAVIRHGKLKKADKTGDEEKDLPKIRARVRHENVKKADEETGGEENAIETSSAGEMVSSRAEEKIIGELSRLSMAFAPLWRTVLYNMYEGATIEASTFVSDVTGVKATLNVQELIDAYLRENGGTKIKDILEEDQRWMSAVLRNDVQAGKGINEVVGDITARFPNYSEGRAETIARTEIHQASGYASNEMMKTAAPGMQKTWICTFENSREAHMEADGQTVPVPDDFNVGGESVAYPGDGSAENSINCQCEVEYAPTSSEQVTPSEEAAEEET